MNGLELKPNCLLTRYPIVFLSGRKSLFRLFDYWNEIPLYLREHGYDVWELEAPPGKDRTEAILRALEDLPADKCHLIGDSSSGEELEALARVSHPKIASLTCVRNPNAEQRTKKTAPKPEDLKPFTNAIEYLELTQSEKPNTNWRTLMAGFCLFVHNHVFLDRSRRVDPIETGEFDGSFAIASRFLDLAVTLAERDLMSGEAERGEKACASMTPIHS